MAKKHLVKDVQQLLDQGQTQEAAASQLRLSERTIRYWLSKGLLQTPSSNRAAEVLPEEFKDSSVAEASAAGEVNDSSSINIHTVWTAPDLLAMGISDKDVPRMSLTLTALAKRGNLRLHEWLTRIMLLPIVPYQIMGWRDAYALFPILARDIDAPALVNLGRLMRHWAPWKSRVRRMHYHRLAAPVVHEVMASITDWAWHAGRIVAIPYVELAKTGLSGNEAVTEHLSRGRGASFVRYPGLEQDFKRLSSRPSSPYDVLSHLVARLPDFDRQPRRVLRKFPQMHALAMYWCAAVTDEWLETVRREQERSWVDETLDSEEEQHQEAWQSPNFDEPLDDGEQIGESFE